MVCEQTLIIFISIDIYVYFYLYVSLLTGHCMAHQTTQHLHPCPTTALLPHLRELLFQTGRTSDFPSFSFIPGYNF